MVTKKKQSGRLYAVHVITTLKKPLNKYVHVGVKQYYQEGGILYIEEERSALRKRAVFQYSMDHIKEVRIREIFEGEFWRKS